MKIARFVARDGQIHTGQMVAPRRARPIVGDLFGDYSLADREVEIERYLPPIAPPNIFAIGRNYKAHAAETGSALPAAPMVFMKPTTALLGCDDAIVLPPHASGEVDFEAELAIIIGRAARCVPAGAAMDYVLGFTCANDVSARDCQRDDKQWSRAKGFDTFCPLGPWLVTVDALDPDHCAISSRLNGQVMQAANTHDMVHSCRVLVSYLSHQFTLLPGTLILTGTPEGVGMARTPPVFLRADDRIEIEIEGIGVLANVVR